MPHHPCSFLTLLLVLCKICKLSDEDALKTHLRYCSMYLTDSEFTKLVYAAMKILFHQKCDQMPCEDWLISHLYKIYRSS